jgi:hypothetical protein
VEVSERAAYTAKAGTEVSEVQAHTI